MFSVPSDFIFQTLLTVTGQSLNNKEANRDMTEILFLFYIFISRIPVRKDALSTSLEKEKSWEQRCICIYFLVEGPVSGPGILNGFKTILPATRHPEERLGNLKKEHLFL